MSEVAGLAVDEAHSVLQTTRVNPLGWVSAVVGILGVTGRAEGLAAKMVVEMMEVLGAAEVTATPMT